VGDLRLSRARLPGDCEGHAPAFQLVLDRLEYFLGRTGVVRLNVNLVTDHYILAFVSTPGGIFGSSAGVPAGYARHLLGRYSRRLNYWFARGGRLS
jgi:hypothetical protein